MAKQFRRLNGDTPEALEALSWVARGQLAAGRVDEAIQQAEDIERSSQAALGTRTLDSEPHLPLALGAAYEVQAEALYSQHNSPKPSNSCSRPYESFIARRSSSGCKRTSI